MKNFNSNTTNNDEWLTPPEIISSLGSFDLDPCAPINRPWDTATTHYTKIDEEYYMMTRENRGKIDDTITAIFATIARLSCDKCDPHENARECQDREKQCSAHFHTEAEAIYAAHVKPLEDELVKADALKMLLAEALEECVCIIEENNKFCMDSAEDATTDARRVLDSVEIKYAE